MNAHDPNQVGVAYPTVKSIPIYFHPTGSKTKVKDDDGVRYVTVGPVVHITKQTLGLWKFLGNFNFDPQLHSGPWPLPRLSKLVNLNDKECKKHQRYPQIR